MIAQKTLDLINAEIERRQEISFRRHLGASQIGRECMKEIWLSYHWAKAEYFSARKLRIFDRGHREEERFVEWLSNAGIMVTASQENGEQFKAAAFNGHFGGSTDGLITNVPDFPTMTTKGILECKTHKESSFKALSKAGAVEISHFSHFVQSNIYMGFFKLPFALYLAINKDNDALYAEVLPFSQHIYSRYWDKAEFLLSARECPQPLSKSPTWFKCKWCNFTDICHRKEVAAINCRSCVHSYPTLAKQWFCERRSLYLPYEKEGLIAMGQNCPYHLFYPQMLGKVEHLAGSRQEHWFEVRRFDEIIRYGEGYCTSSALQFAV